ncbi:hypothetical protein V5799_008890 [Amblyomma americanum]|uniref:Uncharacterized protein n=1 Tax=Amblyomma americanum TaxID=6943 RepID=A0AAQ4FBZ2_AMBAM
MIISVLVHYEREPLLEIINGSSSSPLDTHCKTISILSELVDRELVASRYLVVPPEPLKMANACLRPACR